jgi:hypothetical protein
MHKKRFVRFIFFIVILCVASLGMNFILSGKLTLKDFPLQEKWIVNLDGHVKTISTNGDQIIFARTAHELYALDVHSGEILWQHDLAWQGIPRPPIVSNGLVYLADGKRVWAFDQVNGDMKWMFQVPETAASVNFVSENVVVVEMLSEIFVLDAMDGSELWSKGECRWGGIHAYIEESHLYIPCIDGLTIMNPFTGEIELKAKVPFEIATVAYQEGAMYYSPNRNTVSAMSLQDQSMIWIKSFQGEGFRKFTVLGGYLSVTGDDQFCIFQRETGDREWCSDFTKPQDPTLIGNTLYILNGYLNNITAFDMMTGNRLGNLSVSGIRIFTVEKELMATTDDVLIFANGSKVIAFGE